MQPNWTQKTKHKLGIDCMDVVKDDTFIFFIGCFYFILGNWDHSYGLQLKPFN